MDIEAYLRRISYYGSHQPSAAALRELHRQHLFTVPFENLDIALRTPIRLQVPLLYEKIVVRRRGGFCYELNGLFAALLSNLGYSVNMLSGRVRSDRGGFGPEFDHMLLKVDLEEAWLADVGFGESFLDPLPLCGGTVEELNGHQYSLLQDGQDWQLMRHDKNGHVPLYLFRDRPEQLSDFEGMCTYHQSSPESHFTTNRICTRAFSNGRITLSGTRLIVTRDGVRTESDLHGEEEVRRCLRENFGVMFDRGVDISPLCV